MAKLSPAETKIHTDAFLASKATTVAEREAAGTAAVEAFRAAQKKPKGAHVGMTKKMKNRPQTIMEAVDQGIKDGSR